MWLHPCNAKVSKYWNMVHFKLVSERILRKILEEFPARSWPPCLSAKQVTTVACAELRNGRLQRPPRHNSVTLRTGTPRSSETSVSAPRTPGTVSFDHSTRVHVTAKHLRTFVKCPTQWLGNRRTEAVTWGQDLLQSPIPGAINFSCCGPPCVRSL